MAGAIRGTPTAASPLSPCVEADLARHVLSFVLGGLYRRVLLQAGLASAACDRAFERAALRGLRRVRSDGRLLLRELAGMSGDSRGEDDEGTCRSQAWDARERDHDEISFCVSRGELALPLRVTLWHLPQERRDRRRRARLLCQPSSRRRSVGRRRESTQVGGIDLFAAQSGPCPRRRATSLFLRMSALLRAEKAVEHFLQTVDLILVDVAADLESISEHRRAET
jgi:hypothetical protein